MGVERTRAAGRTVVLSSWQLLCLSSELEQSAGGHEVEGRPAQGALSGTARSRARPGAATV